MTATHEELIESLRRKKALSTPAHETNLTTNIVSVEHPDTKETVTVAPYPWTQEEFEKVNQ